MHLPPDLPLEAAAPDWSGQGYPPGHAQGYPQGHLAQVAATPAPELRPLNLPLPPHAPGPVSALLGAPYPFSEASRSESAPAHPALYHPTPHGTQPIVKTRQGYANAPAMSRSEVSPRFEPPRAGRQRLAAAQQPPAVHRARRRPGRHHRPARDLDLGQPRGRAGPAAAGARRAGRGSGSGRRRRRAPARGGQARGVSRRPDGDDGHRRPGSGADPPRDDPPPRDLDAARRRGLAVRKAARHHPARGRHRAPQRHRGPDDPSRAVPGRHRRRSTSAATTRRAWRWCRSPESGATEDAGRRRVVTARATRTARPALDSEREPRSTGKGVDEPQADPLDEPRRRRHQAPAGPAVQRGLPAARQDQSVREGMPRPRVQAVSDALSRPDQTLISGTLALQISGAPVAVGDVLGGRAGRALAQHQARRRSRRSRRGR